MFQSNFKLLYLMPISGSIGLNSKVDFHSTGSIL